MELEETLPLLVEDPATDEEAAMAPDVTTLDDDTAAPCEDDAPALDDSHVLVDDGPGEELPGVEVAGPLAADDGGTLEDPAVPWLEDATLLDGAALEAARLSAVEDDDGRLDVGRDPDAAPADVAELDDELAVGDGPASAPSWQ